MSVLSLRHRIEYIVVGITTATLTSWVAYLLAMTEGAGLLSLVIGLGGIGILRQFVFFPPKIPFRDWLRDTTTPTIVGHLEDGTFVYERWKQLDFAEVYNRDFNLIGYKQRPWTDRRHIASCIEVFIPCINEQRLSWLLQKTAPPLPFGRAADVISDNMVVGRTSFIER